MPRWHIPCSSNRMSSSFPIPREAVEESQHPLARAFASFTEAASSLERAYGQLQSQVAQLRQELAITNSSLASSLEENRRMRERLRRILESLPCGVLVVEASEGDGQGRPISALNPEAVRLIGRAVSSSEELSTNWRTALDGLCGRSEETELPLANLIPSAAAASASTEGEDTASWVAIRHAWLEQAESHPTSVYILRDISDAKRMERERETLRRQQALVEVSALLAHEIRNPLGSLELFAGLLAEANLESEQRRWVEHVQAGLRTLSSTVNNVLHLHNPPPPNLNGVDAGELLEWAYDFLLPLAKQARVEMQIVNGLHGVVIAADRHRLEQVLLNLALNAFDFMPAGGWLCLRGRADADNVNAIAIEVRDTGPGIASHDLSRIFDAGFSTRSGSSGLGLSVCRSIVEQHCGSIQAESKPGSGTTFFIRLPRQQMNPQIIATGSLENRGPGALDDVACEAGGPSYPLALAEYPLRVTQ